MLLTNKAKHICILENRSLADRHTTAAAGRPRRAAPGPARGRRCTKSSSAPSRPLTDRHYLSHRSSPLLRPSWPGLLFTDSPPSLLLLITVRPPSLSPLAPSLPVVPVAPRPPFPRNRRPPPLCAQLATSPVAPPPRPQPPLRPTTEVRPSPRITARHAAAAAGRRGSAGGRQAGRRSAGWADQLRAGLVDLGRSRWSSSPSSSGFSTASPVRRPRGRGAGEARGSCCCCCRCRRVARPWTPLRPSSVLTTSLSSSMSKRTKKVGITGKYGVRYGASLRKTVKKMEVWQHGTYVRPSSPPSRHPPQVLTMPSLASAFSQTCTWCGKDAVKRTAVGIWKCRGCKKTVRRSSSCGL